MLHIGSLKQDKTLTEKIKKLQWIQFTHLELPFAFDTLSSFESAKKNLIQIQNEFCPNEKL